MQIRQKIAINSMLAEAEALENAAYRLRKDAEQAELSIKAEARYKAIRSSWRVVLGFMQQGLSEEVAVRHAAGNLGLNTETVQVHWGQAKKRRAIVKKWSRDREIFRLAHTHSNGQLAATFGISKVTVSRVIRDALKQVHMRKPIIALAATFAILAPLSDDAMAAETCPMDHAIYSAKEKPEFKMTFRPDENSQTHASATIADGKGVKLIDATFSFSNGYSSDYMEPESPFVEKTDTGQAIIVVAFDKDFSANGVSGDNAPYAIVAADLGHWLFYRSKPNSRSIPEGAWILTGCQK